MPIEVAKLRRVAAASAARPARPAAGLWRRRGVSGRDRLFFTERLALLLETGTPLHESLETLEGQADATPMRDVLGGVRRDVEGGASFSAALARHAEVFPPAYVNLVAAGEKAGFLPAVLARLAELDERRQELRSTLLAALAYPAFLIVLSLGVVIFVLVGVFPKFGELFAMLGPELPATTRVLMGVSTMLRERWPLVLGGVAGLLFLGRRWLAAHDGGALVERVVLRVPVLRGLFVELKLVQLMHLLGLSLQNGVPMLDALRSAREAVGGTLLRRFVESLETRVAQGQGIASGFRDAEFLPPLAGQLIATGEQTGDLGRVMRRIAEFYEREWRKRLTAATKLVEPALLLVMGVVVGLLVASLVLPIFKLSRVVR